MILMGPINNYEANKSSSGRLHCISDSAPSRDASACARPCTGCTGRTLGDQWLPNRKESVVFAVDGRRTESSFPPACTAAKLPEAHPRRISGWQNKFTPVFLNPKPSSGCLLFQGRAQLTEPRNRNPISLRRILNNRFRRYKRLPIRLRG